MLKKINIHKLRFYVSIILFISSILASNYTHSVYVPIFIVLSIIYILYSIWKIGINS